MDTDKPAKKRNGSNGAHAANGASGTKAAKKAKAAKAAKAARAARERRRHRAIWLTASEAWRFLRLPSKNTLYRMVGRKALPAYKLGASLRFKKSEIVRYVRKEVRI